MGGVDIAVNATGWGLIKLFLDTSREELEAMSTLQFTGVFQFSQTMIKLMQDKGGSIIQISPATAKIILNNRAVYMGTKSGADDVTRCLANEFGHLCIRANSISPGLTDTPMTAAVVFLDCDAFFMTVETLQVNGGLILRGNPTMWANRAFKVRRSEGEA
jgi:NAD(P)-dependent dehydrogenase (short-subunit alcohol dehydrogenase family)